MATHNLTVIGDVYGRLTVLADTTSPNRRRRVTAKCDCGNVKDYVLQMLRSGRTRSCGCLCAELTRNRNKVRQTHASANGIYKSRAYATWSNMMSRCTNPKTPGWHRYGGRGISVCDRWKGSFENFLEDMGAPPTGMSLDRRDNDHGYSKENCRWATLIEQNNNVGSNIRLEHQGRNLTVSQWAHELGFRVSTLHSRYQNGWSTERMLTTPAVDSRKKAS